MVNGDFISESSESVGHIICNDLFTHQFTPQVPLVCPLGVAISAGLEDGSSKPTLAYKKPPVLPYRRVNLFLKTVYRLGSDSCIW